MQALIFRYFFLFLFFLPSVVFPQWTKFNITGSNKYNYLYSVASLNKKTHFVCGKSGSLYKSSNAGQTWIKQDLNSTADLRDIKFVDDSTGFICGYQGTLFKTIDAGNSWTKISFPDKNAPLYKMQFITKQKAYILSATGYLFKTEDDFNSFTKINTLPLDNIYTFMFTDENTAYAGGFNSFLKTVDAGKTWTDIASPFGEVFLINSIYFFNNNTGLVSGADGVYKTTDGGISWSKAIDIPVNPQSPVGIYNIFFKDSLNGFIAAFFNSDSLSHSPRPFVLYKTKNSGKTWKHFLYDDIKENAILSMCISDIYNIIFLDSYANAYITHTGGEKINPDDSLTIKVENLSNLNCSFPYNFSVLTNTLINSSSIHSSDTISWHISFGDGKDTLIRDTVFSNLSYNFKTFSHSYFKPENYQITIKVKSGNLTDTMLIKLNLKDSCKTTSAVYNNLKQDIIIYPNPARDYIIIKYPQNPEVFNHNQNGSNYSLHVFIRNTKGELLKTCTNCSSISIKNLENGVYFLQLFLDDKALKNQKIIKIEN